jgi:Fe-S-cluster containining protein
MQKIFLDFPYTFNQDACHECGGRCCKGTPGHIWVSTKEVAAIAALLGLNQVDVIRDYLNLVGNRWSIKEQSADSHYACIFFDLQDKKCSVYSSRPEQCRSFPFWNYYKSRVEELIDECPGVRQK